MVAGVASWQQCGDLCYFIKNCNFWHFWLQEKECILYSSCQRVITSVGNIRGNRACHSVESECGIPNFVCDDLKENKKIQTIQTKNWQDCAQNCYFMNLCTYWNYWFEDKKCELFSKCIIANHIRHSNYKAKATSGDKFCTVNGNKIYRMILLKLNSN